LKTVFCSSWAIWPASRHLVVVGTFGRMHAISFQAVWLIHQFADGADVHLDNGNAFCLKIRR
jgi:hypothetical protein